MNGDGTPDYGSCISKKRNAQAYWFITSIAGGMIQSKGTSQGVFFDTREMKPLVNNEAFAKALDFLKETTDYGPPNEINLDVGDTRSLFVSGRCALSLDWGDIGTLAIDPADLEGHRQGRRFDPAGLKAGAEPRHGQARSLHQGNLPPCRRRHQSRAIRRFRRLGRRHQCQGRRESEGRGLRLLLLYGAAGAVECRRDHRQDRLQSRTASLSSRTSANWTKAGMSEAAAKNYLGAIEASLNSPNMILDLRIPQNQKYQQVVLDEAVSRFLAGEIDRDAA